jgi:putative ubiquitin-RnfH superfamily antitoxin RatB of RatAB toxin-antitoxin module
VIRVSVAVALPGRQEVLELELPPGSTAADAVEAARLGERFPGLDLSSVALGIWSHPCSGDMPLREGDRVELYRPLVADAKAERRRRARLTPSSTRSRNGR